VSNNMVSKTEQNTRPPIVVVMGHVDHGKTSILDYIRHANVVSREFGGITQHIGAYQTLYNKQPITFIDTPGHHSFVQMRARGGRAADIAILVVSAEEGVKPQTREAIEHAKAANIPIIVAINKVDLPNSDPQKIKQELASENVLVEDWGGEVVCVEVSAKSGKGIDKLLESILATAEILQLKGSLTSELEAIIVEAKLDKKKGVVVSCIVKNGVLKVGDKVTASGIKAKVRSLMNDRGELVKETTLSMPVEILGFSSVPRVGDIVVAEGSELAELAISEDHMEIIGKDTKRTVALVLKSDTAGTLEAVKASLAEIVTSSVEATYAIKFLLSGTGDITESDVALAKGASGIVLGFNVKLPANVADYAESSKVAVRVFKTIYELIEHAKEVLEGTALTEESKIKGRAQVLKLFKLESGDVIAGCKVVAGSIKDTSRVSVYDKDPADITINDTPLFTGSIRKLKKGKDEVSVVGKDVECGILLKPHFDALQEGMWIEVR
jgi:translation initiation factor IF-2